MKKTILISMLFVLLLGINVFAKSGDIAGNYYTTDIVLDIDGMIVPSYNIGGRTVVIAEELSSYGFDVIWEEESRIIKVYTEKKPETYPSYTPKKAKVSGNIAGTIYETDIVALVNDMWVESYNIGGRTALVVEDMASEDDEAKRMSRDTNPHRDMGYSVALMKAKWNEKERRLSLFCIRPDDEIKTSFGALKINEIDRSGYHSGALSLYKEDESVIKHWVDSIYYGEEIYLCLDDFISDKAKFEIKNGDFHITHNEENIEKVLYTNATTVGACHNNLLFLSGNVFINGNASKTKECDMIFYRGKIYLGKNALNSAFLKEILIKK